ncbi:hypothetical protein [Nitrosovibrio sp. Nv17]|uniref:hypothetical protein n=1 Tax=Nitrosovibrio sp. Nv17 TaxID=1855339 RepID=UPI0009085438|nr:hypothetical protein [Nitrosovibrio sp. Nv17]SFW14198.1 hypothetical protein SAMN05216414_102131 [Nitrosovibrio sp. Nv17]
MDELGMLPWLIVSAIFFVIPFWRIFKRTGFKPGLAFVALIPGGILILLWVVAFAKWPAHPEGGPVKQGPRTEPED